MRKLVWTLLALFVLSSVSVLAAVECKDLDEQPDIEDTLDTTALVEYGIEDKADHCVSGKDGFTVSTGLWVREYYCEGEPEQRKYKDFDCTRYGYDKCDGGKCVGGASTGKTAAPKPSAPAELCGNKKVDASEQCDPPDSICYLEGKIGICTRPNSAGLGGCQCKVYKPEGTAEPAAGAEKPVEENKTTTPAVQEAPPVKEELPAGETQSTKPAAPPAEEERKPLPEESFEEPAGISVTRGITNAVKKFFRWIGSLF